MVREELTVAQTRPRGPALETANRAALRAATSPAPPPSPSPPNSATAVLKWPGLQPTRPVSPSFATRRPSCIAPRREVEVAPRPTHRRRQQPPGDQDVFDRLSRPKVRTSLAKMSEDPHHQKNRNKSGERIQPEYTGHTVPKVFALSVSNNPARFAQSLAKRASESQLARRRPPLIDIQNFDPTARTVPEPFDLQSVRLHDLACARRLLELSHEQKKEEERRRYHAVPLRRELLEGPTFVPVLALPEEQVTIPDEDFCRNSDTRAFNRAQFDMNNSLRLETEAELSALAKAARQSAEDENRRAEWLSHAFRARNVPASHYHIERLRASAPPFQPTSPHTPAVLRHKHGQRAGISDSTLDIPKFNIDNEIELSIVTHDSL